MLALSTFKTIPHKTIELGEGRITAPARTGAEMKAIIRASGTNLYVRKWAERIVKSVPDRNELREIEAIFDFVRRSLRYTKDPRGTEFVQKPDILLTQIEYGDTPGADCDDYTVLALSLLRSIGYQTLIRIAGYTQNGPFSHVYGMVQTRSGVWIPFDAVRKDKALGHEAPGRRWRMDMPV